MKIAVDHLLSQNFWEENAPKTISLQANLYVVHRCRHRQLEIVPFTGNMDCIPTNSVEA
jgi:hypothetical protein